LKDENELKKYLITYYFKLISKKSSFHLFNILLLVLSFFYYLCIFIRQGLYDYKIFKTKSFPETYIISVGNLTTGGTGKTPIVMKLIELLLSSTPSFLPTELIEKSSKKIAVISRGYKRKNANEITLVYPHSQNLNIDDLGDEPFMIANRYSDIYLGIGQDRAEVIKKLLAEKIDICILDDGYQKLSIARNLNILLVDATNPFGNNFLFPRGILREPIKSLKKADLVILTKTNLSNTQEIDSFCKKIKSYGYTKKIILSEYIPIYFYNFFTKQKLSLEDLQGKTVDILTAIGNPKSLEKTLKNLGLTINEQHIFPDHHSFKAYDLKKFKKISNNLIITTEKDSVKLLDFNTTLSSEKIFTLIMDTRFI
jgi:tetraacyldisaccharide 4'-kinase